MLEAEHPEICQADIEEAKFLKSAQDLLKELKVANHITEVHKAMQREKLESHMVHELIYTKEQGYIAVPIPQYERQ